MSKLVASHGEREKLQTVVDDKLSARASAMAEIKDIERRLLTESNISDEHRTVLKSLKMKAESRLIKINAQIKGINRKVARIGTKEHTSRKKLRLERHMRRMRLLSGEYRANPSDPNSLLHALWRVTKTICRRNKIFPDENEQVLIDQIEEYMAEHCELTENGQILLRPVGNTETEVPAS